MRCLCRHRAIRCGVIPCVKHYPGHGDADKDSHLALPTIDLDINEYKNTENVNFVFNGKETECKVLYLITKPAKYLISIIIKIKKLPKKNIIKSLSLGLKI